MFPIKFNPKGTCVCFVTLAVLIPLREQSTLFINPWAILLQLILSRVSDCKRFPECSELEVQVRKYKMTFKSCSESSFWIEFDVPCWKFKSEMKRPFKCVFKSYLEKSYWVYFNLFSWKCPWKPKAEFWEKGLILHFVCLSWVCSKFMSLVVANWSMLEQAVCQIALLCRLVYSWSISST